MLQNYYAYFPGGDEESGPKISIRCSFVTVIVMVIMLKVEQAHGSQKPQPDGNGVAILDPHLLQSQHQ